MAEPTRVLSFTGSVREFLDALDRWSLEAYAIGGRAVEVYEWQITASIARHPAGKGLGRGN